MKKLRRYQKRKLLKSIEITSLAGIAGLCGYLILSQEDSKEISQNSNNSAQVKMKEDMELILNIVIIQNMKFI